MMIQVFDGDGINHQWDHYQHGDGCGYGSIFGCGNGMVEGSGNGVDIGDDGDGRNWEVTNAEKSIMIGGWGIGDGSTPGIQE